MLVMLLEILVGRNSTWGDCELAFWGLIIVKYTCDHQNKIIKNFNSFLFKTPKLFENFLILVF